MIYVAGQRADKMLEMTKTIVWGIRGWHLAYKFGHIKMFNATH